MFKFLKDKLSSTIAKISEKIKAEGKEEIIEEVVDKSAVKLLEPKQEIKKEEKKGFFEKIKEAFVGKSESEEVREEEEAKPEDKKEEQIEQKLEIEKPELEIEEKEEKAKKLKEEEKLEEVKPKHHKDEEGLSKAKEKKKGFFQTITEKIITKRINEKQFEDLFWDLELALLENNVAVEVVEKIKEDLKIKLVDKPIKRTKVEETITEGLTLSIKSLFQESASDLDLVKLAKKKRPYIICFFGINGSGKTTSIAKIAKMLKDNKFSVVISASDTFRAASIDQLQKHADALGVKLIKHDYGSDPAAVAFDAIKHAESKKADVVLIDTAGRMHSNTNLIQEMQKIVRVTKPDLKIFVGESITGNDCVEQAKTFNDAIGIDGIILAKADIDEKGGAAVSVSYVTKKPILYLGTGQKYDDLQKFDPEIVIKGLGLEA